MNIAKKKLKEILSDVWEDAYHGNVNIEDILLSHNIKEEDDIPLPEVIIEQEERIYSVKELLEMPLPVFFIHKDCGKCHLEDYENGRKIVFADTFESAGIKFDGYPFDVPMLQIPPDA